MFTTERGKLLRDTGTSEVPRLRRVAGPSLIEVAGWFPTLKQPHSFPLKAA